VNGNIAASSFEDIGYRPLVNYSLEQLYLQPSSTAPDFAYRGLGLDYLDAAETKAPSAIGRRRRLVGLIAQNEGSETASKIDLASRFSERIAKGIGSLLELAAEEEFETGMESNLSAGLIALIARFPEKSMEALTGILRSRNVSNQVLGEILRVLGRVEGKATAELRFVLLVSHLKHRSAIIRDAAAVGLALLGDSRAVPFLRNAIQVERIQSLRIDLEGVVEDLEN
jgi:hypothetical protein